MIALQIFLWLLVFLLALILVVLLMPLTVFVSLRDKFSARIYVFGIPVFSTARKKKEKPKKVSVAKQKKKDAKELHKLGKKAKKKKKDNIWKRVNDKLGFVDAVKSFSGLARVLLKKLAWVLKRIHFRKFRFSLRVAADDAAQTAIQYGIVCGTVYPVLELLFSVINCKADKIDISADFNHTKSEFRFSLAVRTQLLLLVIAGLSGWRAYKKWERDFHE